MNVTHPLSTYPDRVFDLMLPHLLSFEMALCVKQWSDSNENETTLSFLSLIEEMWRRIALRKPTETELYMQYNRTVGILLNAVWQYDLLTDHSRPTIKFLHWAVGSRGIRHTIRKTLEEHAGWKPANQEYLNLEETMESISHGLGNQLRLL